jgi:hypothetical protein
MLAASPGAARPWAGQILHDQCLLHSADPKNPWALAHGVTALGANFVAADGRRATEVMVGDFLKANPGDAGSRYGFDLYAADGTPIEPHPNLIAKTLVNAGLPLSSKFRAPGGEVTLQALVRGVEKGFHPAPQNEAYWREVGWTLDLLSVTRKPGAATFENESGEKVDLDAVMEQALAYLELANKELSDGMDQGLPQVDKNKRGIYAHNCGGLHLVQAVLSWARFPEVRKKWGKRLDRQLAVLFYRLGSESRQYDAVLQKVHDVPGNRLLILTQMVKFYGHFLETTGRARADGVFAPDAAQKQQIARAKALLDAAVRGLDVLKAFQSMEQLKANQRQVWLDLIGDSCHASHGFDYWK